MSSSAARFLALPLSEEKADAAAIAGNERPAVAEISDESLLAQISRGDREALALLFRRYARLVWRIAERILKDSAEAEDVMQEVFLCIYRKASVFDCAKGPARSLIVHMAYQHAFTRRRYLGARHFPTSRGGEKEAVKITAPAASMYDESIEAHFGRDGLRKALADMSEGQRETLRLYFFEDYTLEEIARQLGQSAGNVKHHYYRGLDKLRKHMPRRPGSGEGQAGGGKGHP